MVEIVDKHLCCGCAACVQRCPKHCISLKEDGEGFLYPEVDRDVCVNCGICEKVCPVLNVNSNKRPLHVYAVKNNNEQQRLNSSSGGVFIALAERIIDDGGVVFGCRYDNKWEVYHCKAETKEELIPLMRSKYLQSRIENTYKEAEGVLKKGVKVLFVGTPCQIAGLKLFLRKNYDNLITVDFICHGVPSPGIWRLYLQSIKAKQGLGASIISDINFRNKRNFGWKKFGFTIDGKFSVEDSVASCLLSNIAVENPFMRGFLSNIYLRPSCYQCPTKNGSSMSDLTIADYWCIDKILPNYFDDDKGTSLVFVNSFFGMKLLEKLNIDKVEAPFKETIEKNKSYYQSPVEPQKRSLFFSEIRKHKDFDVALAKYYKPTLLDKIKRYKNLILKKS